MSIAQEELQEIIDKVCKKQDIQNYTLTIEKGSKKGDNYFGHIFRAEVTSKTQQKSFIIKCAERDKVFRNEFELENLYQSEVFFYEKLQPLYEKLCQEHGVSYKSSPKCYDFGLELCKEYLVLENLNPDYLMGNRKKPLEEPNIIAILQAYAKFHALSIVLQELHPEDFEEVSKALAGLTEKMQKDKKFADMMAFQAQTLIDAVKNECQEETLEHLLGFKEKLEKVFQQFSDKQFPNNIFLHGDCWCNNILIKFSEERKIPLDVRFIDFQFMRQGSVASDLTYFLSTSCPADVLNQYQEYLKIYYDSLVGMLNKFDLPLKLTFDELLRNFAQYSGLGFLLGCMTLRGMLKEEDEVVEFVDSIGDGIENMLKQQSKEIRGQDEYLRRVLINLQFIDRAGGLTSLK